MNSEDKELLNLAAKAAGHSLLWADDGSMCWLQKVWEGQYNTDDSWNPFANDGDALRLTVALIMHINTNPLQAEVMYRIGEGCPRTEWVPVSCGVDKYAATRRAIVRAAAEIGRNVL